jgi:protein ImuA
LRRLQVHAQQGDAPVFVFRPSAAQAESSPAPLRLAIEPGQAWSLRVRLLKRRGPVYEGVMELPCLPQRLAGVLAVRLAGRAATKPPASEQTKRPDLLVLADLALLPDGEPLEKRHGALAGLAADPVAEPAH